MIISESTWVHYIKMVQEGWSPDVITNPPTWRRMNEYLRQKEEMRMTKLEIEIWEKVTGMSLVGYRTELRKLVGKK